MNSFCLLSIPVLVVSVSFRTGQFLTRSQKRLKMVVIIISCIVGFVIIFAVSKRLASLSTMFSISSMKHILLYILYSENKLPQEINDVKVELKDVRNKVIASDVKISELRNKYGSQQMCAQAVQELEILVSNKDKLISQEGTLLKTYGLLLELEKYRFNRQGRLIYIFLFIRRSLLLIYCYLIMCFFSVRISRTCDFACIRARGRQS